MKILVLGGNGFIGHNLILRLLKEGHELSVFDRNFNEDRILSQCKYITGEFREVGKLREMFIDIDIVYHLISTTLPKTSNDDPAYDIDSNVINTIKLLEICHELKVKKIIFASSGGTIYGLPQSIPIKEEHFTDPICSYGITKLMIEKYLYMFYHLYGLDYQILRISNPYGPFQNPFSQQGAIGVFLGKILRGESIEIWGDGTVSRDYVYIGDVTEALYLASIRSTNANRVLNIGSGEGNSINTLLDIIKNVTGENFKVIYKEARRLDIPASVLDITKATEHLGWNLQVDLSAGIKMTWDWLRTSFK